MYFGQFIKEYPVSRRVLSFKNLLHPEKSGKMRKTRGWEMKLEYQGGQRKRGLLPRLRQPPPICCEKLNKNVVDGSLGPH